ncbi:IpaD/SipD/SspD family type III secretion system needle tip protein, partial [Escherichia coli]|nr:IpaD/SipD/SspD family type III secretion system needle tip protein [Escherichia coli]
NTIDGKLKDPAKILTLHNSVRKTLANVAHNTTGPGAMATTKGTLTHVIASLDSFAPEMRSSATSSTLTASSSSEFKSDKYIC